jgi:TonB family protein
VGTVYVTGSSVNVRREGSTAADILAQVKRGDRLALLASGGDWMQVRLADGTTGYVARSLVSSAPPSTRPRRGNCPPDSDFRFTTTPTPSFSQDGPHGLVVVEATVDTRGNVTTTRIVSNDTGEPALGALAEREIRNAKFAPPIRDCAPKAFIYTYKRTF